MEKFSSSSFLLGSKGSESSNFSAVEGETVSGSVESVGGSVAEAIETKDDEEFESRDDFGGAKLRNDGIWDGR